MQDSTLRKLDYVKTRVNQIKTFDLLILADAINDEIDRRVNKYAI